MELELPYDEDAKYYNAIKERSEIADSTTVQLTIVRDLPAKHIE
jgi:hypothetical protein